MESPRGVPRLSRSEVRRVAPPYQSAALGKVTSHECCHTNTDVRLQDDGKTVTREAHGGPICQVAGASAHCDMLRSSTRSRAFLALSSSCQNRARNAAWRPPFRSKFTLLIQFDRRVDVHQKWKPSQCGSFLFHRIEIW